MSEDTSTAKLFIGGLSLSTDKESLQGYFNQYGEIVDVVVMKDPGTSRSRGFGFVTYADIESVDKCLSEGKHHKLDGREVEVKKAVPREATTATNAPLSPKVKKVFLGGLSLDTTEDDIRNVLEAEGELAEIIVMREKDTDKSRGFGFALFESHESVERLCSKKYIKIKDRDVEVKKAISQEEMRKVDTSRGRSGGQQGGYHGGRDHGSFGSGRDPYASYGRSGGMYPPGVASGYEYQYGRTGDYARPDAYYPYQSGYDRSAYAYANYGRGYDMAAAYATGMYGAAGMTGAAAAAAYTQNPSSYGPSRTTGYGSVSGTDYSKDRGTSRQTYHPYRRTQ